MKRILICMFSVWFCTGCGVAELVWNKFNQQEATCGVEERGFEIKPDIIGRYCLHLDKSEITDSDLDGIENMEWAEQLQWLFLQDTQVTDAGLLHLKHLTALQLLNLESTLITDAGVEHLKVFAGVVYLDLTGTRISDAGLVHLAELKELVFLSVKRTEVSAEGVAALRRELPNCLIAR